MTLRLSRFVVPEQLYPWLTLVSGLLVVAVGAAVLRQRLRGRRQAVSDSVGHLLLLPSTTTAMITTTTTVSDEVGHRGHPPAASSESGSRRGSCRALRRSWSC